MNAMISKSLQALLISLLLLICSAQTSANAEPIAPPSPEPSLIPPDPPSSGTGLESHENVNTLPENIQEIENKTNDLQSQVERLAEKVNNNYQQNSLFGIPWFIWITSASLFLIAILAVLMALASQAQSKRLFKVIQKLEGKHNDMFSRLDGMRQQLEQERMASRNQPLASATLSPTTLAASTPLASNWPIPQQPSLTIAEPPPVVISAPPPITKSALVSALNSNDRQQLRQAAVAELNITNESENSLAMGKSIATQLEQVTAGGSYWLIYVDGNHWLFPTERTLKGFAAAQPQKGIFRYEPQTIPQPNLIEPALLEKVGAHWQVKILGNVAIPS